jgi:hypothetical protein
MLSSYATGIGAIVVLLMVWVGVQVGWRKVFADVATDPDALAGRMGCHGCSGEDGCERSAPQCTAASKEEHHEPSGHASG